MKAALALGALSATAVFAYQQDSGDPLDIPALPLPSAIALHRAAQPLFDASVGAAPLVLNHKGGDARASLYGLENNQPWFVPEKPLALAAAYTATSRIVRRDPVTRRERVDHRHWTFKTRDGQWRGSEHLALDSLANAQDPQLSAQDDGSVLALWQQSSDGESSLWWNWFSPADGWSAARRLTTSVVGRAKLASNPQGRAIAVWTSARDVQPDHIRETVWAAHYEPEHGWSEPHSIDRPSAGNSHLPDIALSADGSAMAVWETHEAGHIWGNRYQPATGWQGAKLLDRGGTELVDAPRIGADARGRFTLTWRRYHQANTSLWVRLYQPNSGWHYPQRITESADGRVRDHRLAVTDSGLSIALWIQGRGETSRLYASQHTPGLGWQSPIAIQRGPGVETALPALALSPHGDAIAVWMQRSIVANATWQVYASQLRSNRWSVPGALANDGEGGYPRATMDSNGHALVAWSRVDTHGASVWARRYNANSGWSRASAIAADSAMLAALAVNRGGRALALGQRQSDNGHLSVWANRFE